MQFLSFPPLHINNNDNWSLGYHWSRCSSLRCNLIHEVGLRINKSTTRDLWGRDLQDRFFHPWFIAFDGLQNRVARVDAAGQIKSVLKSPTTTTTTLHSRLLIVDLLDLFAYRPEHPLRQSSTAGIQRGAVLACLPFLFMHIMFTHLGPLTFTPTITANQPWWWWWCWCFDGPVSG